MIGVLAGDIIGSRFEWKHTKSTEFPLFTYESRFTDDSVLTLAVADARLHRRPYADCIRSWANRYPNAGYGGMFHNWREDPNLGPYQSFGNGSGMRVSAVAFAASTLEETIEEATASAMPTHDHPEGIKGAVAIAAAIFLARQGQDKAQIRAWIEENVGYNLHMDLDEIRPHYRFDVTCQGSVPEALCCFLESTDVESAIRLAISLGGDADTQACMAGGVAQAFYRQIPEAIHAEVFRRITPEMTALLLEWEATFGRGYELV